MAKKIKNRAFSISNLKGKKFNRLPFDGVWKNSLGNPDKAFSAIIFGNTTNGKTEFAIQWAKELCNYGKVAYNSLEQGVSETMQTAADRNFLEDGKFVLLDREPFEEMFERMRQPKSPQFLFIDSVQYTRINKNQYYEFKEFMLAKRKGVIWVSQAKGKSPKGALADDIWFDVDLKLWVHGFKMFPDGRLNGGGEPYTIWAEKAAKHWGEVI